MHRSILVLLTATLALALSAQDADYRAIQSNQLWLSASVGLKPFKELNTGSYFLTKVNGSLELGYRSEDFFGQTNSFFTDINLNRKINKWLRGGVEYRLSLRGSGAGTRSRAQFFLRAKQKVGQFDVAYKSRYQYRFVSRDRERHVVRNRISVTYRTPNFKVNPQVSAESFTSFRNTGILYSGMRYKLSGNVNLPNGQELDVALVHDREIGVFEPEYRTIVSVGYSFGL